MMKKPSGTADSSGKTARNRLMLMIVKEFRQLRRDRRMLPIVLVAPVLQLLLLGFAANLDPQDVPVIVCDLDRSPQSRDLRAEFFSSGYFLDAGTVEGLADIGEEMEQRRAAAVLVIPRGFGADLLAGRSPPVPWFADGSDSTTASVAMGYGERIVRQYAGLPERSMDIRSRILFNPELKSRQFMVPGLLALVLMVMTLILTSLAVVKEKEIGTMEQLVVTPLGIREIMLGKLLPFGFVGVVDVFLVSAATRVIFGLVPAGSFLLLFGMSLLFLLSMLGFGLLVSTFSENQQQAMMASVFFVMLPMVILSGFVFPVENMPLVIRIFTRLLPPRYYFTLIRGIYLKGAGLAELWEEGVALLVLAVLVLTVSLFRFRKRLE